MDVIGEIFSKDWKRQAFKWVAKADGFVTGYELSRKFGVSFSTAYKFVNKMVNLGVFEHPPVGKDPKEVKITSYGKEIYDKVKVLLDLDK
jgi:Mn-dependent DtxR family transcriptional regulator